jgi:hypothetical protein
MECCGPLAIEDMSLTAAFAASTRPLMSFRSYW